MLLATSKRHLSLGWQLLPPTCRLLGAQGWMVHRHGEFIGGWFFGYAWHWSRRSLWFISGRGPNIVVVVVCVVASLRLTVCVVAFLALCIDHQSLLRRLPGHILEKNLNCMVSRKNMYTTVLYVAVVPPLSLSPIKAMIFKLELFISPLVVTTLPAQASP